MRTKKIPTATKTITEGRAKFKTLGEVASRFEHWRPATSVLTAVRGVQTRFVQVDAITKIGAWPIERVCTLHGPSNEGKAQSVDEPVLTPSGWVRIGQLRVGDRVIDPSTGKPVLVSGVFPQGKREMFKVTFSDGGSTECCLEHLWFTTTPSERSRGMFTRGPRPERRRIETGHIGRGTVKSLASIFECFEPGLHEVPLTVAVEFESVGDLPIDPYLLGLMLGDGGFTDSTPRFHKGEEDLREAIKKALPDGDTLEVKDSVSCSVRGGRLMGELRKLDLAGCRSWEKFVPDVYMRASVTERLWLLRGLVDTDGSVVKDGNAIEYSTSSHRLASQFIELARSLGALVNMEERKPNYTYKDEVREGRVSWRIRVYFDNGILPCASQKHLAKWKSRKRRNRRTIESVESVGFKDAVCIAVASESRMYITRDYIVTHNTAFALGLGLSFLEQGHFFAHIDAEQTTPAPWLRTLMGEQAENPAFVAIRPASYESAVQAVREFGRVIKEAKAAGEIDPNTSGIVVVDSIRKLSPKNLLDELMKAQKGDDEGAPKRGRWAKKPKKGIDGAGGRAAQIKAAMNAQWLDELVPLAASSGITILLITRELTEDEDVFGREQVKVAGGKSLIYEASLVMRVLRSQAIYVKDGDNSIYIGERHAVQMRKTKIGTKDRQMPTAYFHTSNGVASPTGFDRERDIFELGVQLKVVDKSGTWFSFQGKRLGQGEENAIRMLRKEPVLCNALELATRKMFVLEGQQAL